MLDKDASAPAGMEVDMVDEAPHPKRRTATWQETAFHNVTAMVGAGVLGLPGAVSCLGWAGGMVALVLSLVISWHTFRLLVLMHEEQDLDSKDADGWRRHDRYQDLTTRVMGPRAGWWALVPFQSAVLVGICITYTVVGGDDLREAVADWAPAGATPPPWAFYLIFAGLQMLLSQLPDFAHLGFVSLLGAVMSVGYCAIAIGLAASHRPAPDVDYTPLPGKGQMETAFGVLNALTTMMFAYGGHNVGLEIQATLPSPPTVRRMMRGVHIAFIATAVAYFGVSIFGYNALGAAAGDNIILSLNNGPKWLRTAARLMVVVHVGAAYQVYAHPAFEAIENAAGEAVGGSICGRRVAYDGGSRTVRFALRTTYVAFCTLVACLVPFFGELMGLVGAVAITPTTFLLPSLLWLMLRKPRRFGLDWSFNWLIVVVTAAIGVGGTAGSIFLIQQHAATYKLFAA